MLLYVKIILRCTHYFTMRNSRSYVLPRTYKRMPLLFSKGVPIFFKFILVVFGIASFFDLIHNISWYYTCITFYLLLLHYDLLIFSRSVIPNFRFTELHTFRVAISLRVYTLRILLPITTCY